MDTLLLNNLKRLVRYVEPAHGMTGIMDLVLQTARSTKPPLAGDSKIWPTFYTYRHWIAEPSIHTSTDPTVTSFTLANYFGIPPHNYNLTVKSLRTVGTQLHARLISLTPAVLSWVQAIIRHLAKRCPQWIQLITITQQSSDFTWSSPGITRPALLEIRMARWTSRWLTDSLWCFWERYQHPLAPTAVTLIPGPSGITINANQLVTDIFSEPTHQLSEMVGYCHQKQYASVYLHLNSVTLSQAQYNYRKWQRDVIWSRRRQVMVWCWLAERARIIYHHCPDEGTCGMSWWVEQTLTLPGEIRRIIIKYL